ncbi:MAG: D-hexose-6-phosphate mutarotase [Verrucomicrobiota bacterium]
MPNPGVKLPSRSSAMHHHTFPNGSEISYSAHGGNLTCWKTASGEEVLFLSELAEHGPGKAIRGGVPVIFPQFSDHGSFSRHGFARKVAWQDHGPACLTLRSADQPSTEWQNDFELGIHFHAEAETLRIDLEVSNTGKEAWSFQAALHTYLQVGDVMEAKVTGLEGFPFHDEATKEMRSGESSPITFGSEIDRSYRDTREKAIHLIDVDRTISVTATGFPDAVVWNPGPDHGIGDLAEEGWRKFVCIESALLGDGLTLSSGETVSLQQTIRVATK